jgi:uncharacterized damage-inducible protein DinB
MITADYCLMMARYNRWMNERLYALLAEMPDDERKRDRSAFFRSIHGTLNHLLWGDRMWLGRFIDEPCTAPAFGDDMFADFAQLQREREITDQKMLNWAGTVTADWFASTITYTSKVDGKTREIPAAVATIHMFNHESHHRGQLTTLMKQAGCDPGITDLPWLPGVLRVVE